MAKVRTRHNHKFVALFKCLLLLLLLIQYYDDTFPTAKDQKAFERNLFNKTHRANAEVIMLDGLTCVYRSSVDLFFYVMGSANENGVNEILFN